MKSKPYNILYLDNGPGIGGGQRSLLLLLKHLDQRRFCPFVGCLGDSLLAAEVRKAGLTVIPLPLPEPHDKKEQPRRFTLGDVIRDIRQLGVVSQMRRVMKEKRIDLIHANSLATGLMGGVAAKFSHVPILMHKRYATSYGILDRVGEKLLDRVILVSEATRWSFASRSKQVLIYNGVELASFRPPLTPLPLSTRLWRGGQGGEAIRAALKLRRGDVVAGVATRMTPEKGIHLLIEAMAKLKHLPQIKLLVVGGPYFPDDTAYVEDLKAQTRRLGITDRVIFTGFLADIRAVLSLLDMVLLASTIPEACPRTIIEAMAAGVPVIATPLGGSKELVTPDTGILVPPENSSAFANAIAQLAGDSERLNRMGAAGRSRAEQLFGVERNTRLTETLYLRLLNREN
ncbi:glycosyltransferase family 4 protein [Candidatus Poribacteria bacterium]|nr:glycosyltransferase family 4 protein [Candidatus Poribacteria bacterium]